MRSRPRLCAGTSMQPVTNVHVIACIVISCVAFGMALAALGLVLVVIGR